MPEIKKGRRWKSLLFHAVRGGVKSIPIFGDFLDEVLFATRDDKKADEDG